METSKKKEMNNEGLKHTMLTWDGKTNEGLERDGVLFVSGSWLGMGTWKHIPIGK
jgi:hypothetical protein